MWRALVLAASLSGAVAFFGPQAEQARPEFTARDLGEMFFNNTLKKPVVTRIKPRPPKPGPDPGRAKPLPPTPVPIETAVESRRKIGLKYRILLCDEKCNVREVDESRVFHTNEGISLVLESNVDGYLYILNKGPSGAEEVLFPRADENDVDNRIEQGAANTLPTFYFHEPPGEERMTVIVSREPLESFTPPRQEPGPSRQRPSGGLLASVMSEVAGKVQTRDLKRHRQASPVLGSAQPAAQSTYIINTSDDQNHLVYHEIVLRHGSR